MPTSPAQSIRSYRSRNSLRRSVSSASNTYSAAFAAAFKPPPPAPIPPPIPIPGLDGITSDSGVAQVFQLDPRVPKPRPRSKPRGLARVWRKLVRPPEEPADAAAPAPAPALTGHPDRLPKHSNLFTGDISGLSSVYPSSSSADTSEERVGAAQRRKKAVAFAAEPDVVAGNTTAHGSLRRMPSVREPCPDTFPGASAAEVERRQAGANVSFLGVRPGWRRRRKRAGAKRRIRTRSMCL